MTQAAFTPRLIAVGALLAVATASQAVSFTQNDVTLDINGTINGFYLNRDVQVTTKATGATVKTSDSAIGNGLLPGWINFVMTTKVDDTDIKAHFSFAPGLNNKSSVVGLPLDATSGYDAGSAFSQVDTRNVYFQFGQAALGTVKVGRDIGLFGQNIVLSDMTLLGVGGTTGANIPYNTTFGMIGHGYMYTGFQPQITYTSPNLGGFSVAAGIFQPSKFAGNETKTPGLQAKVDYDWKAEGVASGKVWGGLVRQSTSCSTGTCTIQSFNAQGLELGTKVGVGDFEAVAYGFKGKGLGISTIGAQFLGGSDGAGNRTDSTGYLLQGTYKLGATKLGVNYGQNKDKGGAIGAGLEQKNTGLTLGVYHTLNKYITLVGEANQEKLTNATTETKSRTISLGGILFF